MDRKAFFAALVLVPALIIRGTKAQFGYRERPNGSERCSRCTNFIPGSDAGARGRCKLVEGSISPNGWCPSWTAKTHR